MKVYDVTAYDKSTTGSVFHTHIVVGALRTDDKRYLNKELGEYGLTDDNVHFYFTQDEFFCVLEFLYVIERETRITVKAKRKKEKVDVYREAIRTWPISDMTPFTVTFEDEPRVYQEEWQS